MIRRPPRSTQSRSSAASDVYKRQQCYLSRSQRPRREVLAGHKSDDLSLLKHGKGLGRADGCLLYTSDAADDLLCVDLGGRRIIKKKKKHTIIKDRSI